jgi:glucosamine--fructose-6-phosphate aminotransferase (isomerizing)
MCGIVACRRTSGTLDFLLTSLRRLEYRGYDSTGVALVAGDGPLRVVRCSGRVADLERRCSESDSPLAATIPAGVVELGLGHTRWATHGPPTDRNAHPHRDCTGRVAIVHNGIIENAAELSAELVLAGHRLGSDVDSEVVAHLIEDRLAAGDALPDAVLAIRHRLHGSWALGVLDSATGSLVVTAMRSPLLVGAGPLGLHAASDETALAGWVDEVAVLEDGDLVEFGESLAWWDRAGRQCAARPFGPARVKADEVVLNGHEDFTAKEIAEQPALAATLVGRLRPGLDGGLWRDLGLAEPRRVRFVGCGTSLNASAAVARVFRQVAGVPTDVVVASEAADVLDEDGVLTIAISQSGETADVLAALCNVSGPVLAITNNERSTLARRADAILTCGAGLEIGVAATKTFTAQVLAGSALALAFAAYRGGVTPAHRALQRAFAEIPERLEQAHFLAAPVAAAIAAELADRTGFVFLSRGEGMPYAAEGALKLKEITYRWAEAYPAGELKHGPLALITDGTPVVVIDAGDRTKLAGNVSEVTARGAHVLRVGAGEDALFPVLSCRQAPPWGPLEAVVPLQHLARSLAVVLGCDADKPRNLAKSVTVE